ncbi:hypothetical protein ACS0TY_024649 [Phlomoides rotata]
MVEDVALLEHLHKLVVVKSEQEIENLLQLLWLTRKTGLSSSQKSSIQSLLNLPSPGDLDPVLASIRSLIRSCVHKDLEGDDALKLLPPGLPLELDSMLCALLQKHQSNWKEELSQEQHVTGQSQFSHQVNLDLSVPLLLSPSWAVSESLLPLQVDPIPHFNSQNLAGLTPITAERNTVGFPRSTLQNDVVPQEIPLQDYTKCPSNEMEVKFQLTRDTLEAVLRSMAYINKQLSQFVRSSSLPLQKKQRL